MAISGKAAAAKIVMKVSRNERRGNRELVIRAAKASIASSSWRQCLKKTAEEALWPEMLPGVGREALPWLRRVRWRPGGNGEKCPKWRGGGLKIGAAQGVGMA